MRAILIALVGIVVIIIAVGVILFVVTKEGTKKEKVAGCATVEQKPPSFIGNIIYNGNHLPGTIEYTQHVAADAPYVGTYTQAGRAAYASPNTLSLAPYEKVKKSEPVVYVDKNTSCKNIFVSIAQGGPPPGFKFAVYTRK